MKKIYFCRAILAIPFAILLSSSAFTFAQEGVLTVDVVGVRTTGIGIQVSNTSRGTSGGGGGGSSGSREANLKRAQCLTAASAAKTSCEGGYNQLNNICNAYANALAGFGVRTLLTKFGATLPGGTAASITTIATTASVTGNGPCSIVVPQAMAYCAQGAANMASGC